MFNSVICYHYVDPLKLHVMPPYRELIKKNAFFEGSPSFSVYGLTAGIASFIMLNSLNSCQTNPKMLLFTIIIFLGIMSKQCKECSSEYQFITVYQFFIPLLPLFFSCNQVNIIITAIAIGSAIGRLGCISAGCCNGKIKTHGPYLMKYPDPEQMINKKNKTKECYAQPTILIEAAVQFLIAALCLLAPKYASFIFSISSILLIRGTDIWRDKCGKRKNPSLAYIPLLFVSLYCISDKTIEPIICQSDPNYIRNFLISLIFSFVYSNDINIKHFLKGE